MSSPPSLSPSPSPSDSSTPPRAPMYRDSPVPISPRPPIVPATAPPGAFMVELLIYDNGPPSPSPSLKNDHWTYWVRSRPNPDIGVQIHAAGDVVHGFEFEVNRGHNLAADKYPTKRVPLQWVEGRFFDEKRMLNDGVRKVDRGPVCGFEEGLFKVGVPGKRVDSVVEDKDTVDDEVGGKITQRDSQTWIVASAEQLLADGIFTREFGVDRQNMNLGSSDLNPGLVSGPDLRNLNELNVSNEEMKKCIGYLSRQVFIWNTRQG